MLNYDDVVLRLLSLGYELQEDDEFTLEQAMIETEQYIMNYCNLESVPEGLNMLPQTYAVAVSSRLRLLWES